LCDKKDIVTPISTNDEVYRKKLGFQKPVNYRMPFTKFSKYEIFNFLLTGKRVEFYNHMSCSEIKKYLSSNVYNNYYKFCFERNPYDKLISLFYHHGGFKKFKTIKKFIESGELGIIKGYDQYTINDVIAVDDIFKYEDLNNSLKIISERLDLKNILQLPEKKIKSEFRNRNFSYKDLIGKEEKDLIDIAWARELKLFSYDF
jgi:hypothetical protein